MTCKHPEAHLCKKHMAETTGAAHLQSLARGTVDKAQSTMWNNGAALVYIDGGNITIEDMAVSDRDVALIQLHLLNKIPQTLSCLCFKCFCFSYVFILANIWRCIMHVNLFTSCNSIGYYHPKSVRFEMQAGVNVILVHATAISGSC